MRPDMDCSKREVIQDYLDGRLPNAASAEVRAHLRRCSECSREADALAALDAAVRAMPRPDPGPEFSRAVMSAVQALPAASQPGRARLCLSRWEMAGLAALYAAVALLLVPAAGWVAQAPLWNWWARAGEAATRSGAAALARLDALWDFRWVSPAALPVDVGAAMAIASALVLLLLARLPLYPSQRRATR